AYVISQLKKGKLPPGLKGKYEVIGSIANKRGNGIDVILRSKSGKYVFVEVKSAARYVSPGSGFNKFQRSFNAAGTGGKGYVREQMTRIVRYYQTGTGQFTGLKSGKGFLTGAQAVKIHQAILKQGGYSNIRVYVARLNNVTSQQIPGTNIYRYTGDGKILWF